MEECLKGLNSPDKQEVNVQFLTCIRNEQNKMLSQEGVKHDNEASRTI